MRPIMTRAELATHQVASYGRDYSESDDGYSDMEAEERRGWRVLANWGRDGWDLGDWPYVMIYHREHASHGGAFQLLQIVEGDRTLWAFGDPADRDAATDYLFLWYAATRRWAPITADQREQLDAGYPLAIDQKWRGPCQV